VREPAQCRALAAEDASVFTSLLDARRVAGDSAMDASLRAIVDDPVLWPPAAYLAARQAERAARHARFDDTAYNLEPNLKEGPGGLRTLDSLRWMGLRLAGAGDLPRMVEEGLLDPAELGGSAYGAAISSFCLFACGAFFPVAPYLFSHGRTALLGSIVASAACLALIGIGTSLFTGRSMLFSITRQLLITAAAAGITFGMGHLLGAVLA